MCLKNVYTMNVYDPNVYAPNVYTEMGTLGTGVCRMCAHWWCEHSEWPGEEVHHTVTQCGKVTHVSKERQTIEDNGYNGESTWELIMAKEDKNTGLSKWVKRMDKCNALDHWLKKWRPFIRHHHHQVVDARNWRRWRWRWRRQRRKWRYNVISRLFRNDPFWRKVAFLWSKTKNSLIAAPRIASNQHRLVPCSLVSEGPLTQTGNTPVSANWSLKSRVPDGYSNHLIRGQLKHTGSSQQFCTVP